MIILAALVATVVLAFRVWSRLDQMDTAIAALTARVGALEHARAQIEATVSKATTVHVVPPAIQPTSVREPQARATPTPTPTPTPVPTLERPPVPPAAARLVRPPSLVAPTMPAMDSSPAHETSRDALERRIGSRWLLYVGVVAIVVGVAYFEKLSIDNHWISETTRILQGGVAGLLLIAGGLHFVRKGYRVYGQILSGSGVAILYVSTYAAFNFYHLLSQPVAFGVMSGVTMLAAWLADRQRSQGLALVAVGGGFATPFLLPTSTDAEAALFGYDTFLIAGTMFLSHRRDWPTLNVVSYGFTVLTFFTWAEQFYLPSKYLTTELFLTVFAGMFLYILQEVLHSQHPSARIERAILWTSPFGYYVVSLAILAEHSSALLVFLVLLSFVGVVVSVRVGAWLRLVFWLAAAAPLLVWSGLHGNRTWLVAGLAAWIAVYVLNLAGLLEGTVWKGRRFAGVDIVLLHLNGLALYAGAYLLVDPVHPSVSAPLAAALASVNGVIAVTLLRRFRDEAIHFAALAFTLLTIAIGLQLDGAWITSAWAAEGAVVIWLGLRERREWLRAGGAALFGIAIGRLLTLQFSPAPVGEWPLLNERALCGVFVIALTYAITWVHRRDREGSDRATEVGIGLLLAKLLLLALAASETLSFWSLRVAPPFEPAGQVIAAELLIGLVIMWLGLRRQQEWFRAMGGAIVAGGALSLFTIQLQSVPADYVSLINARAGAGALAVIVLYVLAAVHRRLGKHVHELQVNIAILTTSASLLTLSLLTSEIDAYWAARGASDVWSIAREALQAIAWSGVGGFLIWRGLSNRRVWVRAIGGVLLSIGILRLLHLEFAVAAPAYIVVANARVMASMVLIALLYGLAHIYRHADVAERRYGPSTVLALLANALTLTLLTSEISAYWQVHDAHAASTSVSVTSHFAREMMLSITWAVYATVLVVVGLWKRYAPIRYFAMTVFVITIVKVFAIDLAELDRLYRVLSVVGLGVTLLLTSYLYQRLSSETRH